MSHNLSSSQQLAAYCFDAPVCILAGAGSGKTRVITHRIAHLVKEKNANPASIMAVTFTNKAAREMRERVAGILGEEASKPILLGTFHGIAVRFLRYYGDYVGIPNNFLIYDEDDALKLIKRLIKERYALSKTELSDFVSEVWQVRKYGVKKNKIADTKAEKIFEAYVDEMRRINALDFDDLLVSFLDLLENEETFQRISSKVRHLLVDEYQDVNLVQSKIVHLLSMHAQSVAIVGDDDQSIYGWRGADAGFMSKFIQSFPSTNLVRLEENYRSTAPILAAANGVISNNKDRLGKNLISVRGDGPLIGIRKSYRDLHEASMVVEQILREYEKYGSGVDIAVLVRTNALSRPIEESLYRSRIPYRIVGGMKFYDRKEIKDIIASARACINPKSDVDILRMLDCLPLGIGKQTVSKIAEFASAQGLSLFEVMANSEHLNAIMINAGSKKKIDDFVHCLLQVKNTVKQNDYAESLLKADEAVSLLIEQFGFITKFEKKNDEESLSRIANIEQLIQASANFVADCEKNNSYAGLDAFLETVALISADESVVSKNDSSFGVVTIMTLHAAKGLEFDVVFLIGMEEGILPHARSFTKTEDSSELEEERRLVYVGFTRAKNKLFLSYCQERFLHGKVSRSKPSRFLKEIPTECIELQDRWLLEQIKSKNYFEDDALSTHDNKPNEGYRLDYDRKNTAVLKKVGIDVGSKVHHKLFQTGKVLEVSDGSAPKAKVLFYEDKKIRTIMLSHLEQV